MANEFNHVIEPIHEYISTFPVIETELQRKMRHQAAADEKEHWLIPAEVGSFLTLLTKVTRARRVYEIGSCLGYSATWFAQALPEDGVVVLTENDPDRFKKATTLLEQDENRSKMELRHCDAHTDLSSDPSTYDIILIDHDKPNYAKAYPIAKEKLSDGGMIVADNVLWRKRIVDDAWADDASTRGVLEFNDLVMNDPDVHAIIVPIGDGLCLCTPRSENG